MVTRVGAAKAAKHNSKSARWMEKGDHFFSPVGQLVGQVSYLDKEFKVIMLSYFSWLFSFLMEVVTFLLILVSCLEDIHHIQISVTAIARPDNFLPCVPGTDDFLGAVSRRQLFQLVVRKIQSLKVDETPGHDRGQSSQVVGGQIQVGDAWGDIHEPI